MHLLYSADLFHSDLRKYSRPVHMVIFGKYYNCERLGLIEPGFLTAALLIYNAYAVNIR
jgi:hypothetical protein